MFIGHTRFSLFDPSSTAWVGTRSQFKSASEYKAHLFSDERLAPRMKIFTQMTVPQIGVSSRSRDIQHIVAYPTELPRKYKAMLKDAATEWPFLILDEIGGDNKGLNVHRHMRSRIKEGVFGSYRLDDDDVLSLDYFNQVEQYVRPEYAGFVVSLPRGVTGLFEGGKFTHVREVYFPMHSKGHLSVCRINPDGTVTAPPSTSHNKADRVGPVIMDARFPSHVWTQHLNQDTTLGFGDHEQARERVLTQIRKNPPLSDDINLSKVFPMVDFA